MSKPPNKRLDRFTAAALQGLLANPRIKLDEEDVLTIELEGHYVSDLAIKIAKEVISDLDFAAEKDC